MLRELPVEVRSIVTRANTFLRLRLSLEHAWTQETKITHTMLPEKHTIIQGTIGDLWELVAQEGEKHRDSHAPYLKHLELGFDMLDNPEEGAEVRSDAFSLVRAFCDRLTTLIPGG